MKRNECFCVWLTFRKPGLVDHTVRNFAKRSRGTSKISRQSAQSVRLQTAHHWNTQELGDRRLPAGRHRTVHTRIYRRSFICLHRNWFWTWTSAFLPFSSYTHYPRHRKMVKIWEPLIRYKMKAICTSTHSLSCFCLIRELSTLTLPHGVFTA